MLLVQPLDLGGEFAQFLQALPLLRRHDLTGWHGRGP
jgi:hypothetical protein